MLTVVENQLVIISVLSQKEKDVLLMTWILVPVHQSEVKTLELAALTPLSLLDPLHVDDNQRQGMHRTFVVHFHPTSPKVEKLRLSLVWDTVRHSP